MRQKLYYRIAETKHAKNHVFSGCGNGPLQDTFPDVEHILEKHRPAGKDDRGNSVYLREDKDFSKTGVPYNEGYIHTVHPIGEPEQRDLVWTGILQLRYITDEHIRKDLRPDLTDDQIADKWWSGEGSETPHWEWVAKKAAVVDVEDCAVTVRLEGPLLGIFDSE